MYSAGIVIMSSRSVSYYVPCYPGVTVRRRDCVYGASVVIDTTSHGMRELLELFHLSPTPDFPSIS